jgi:hypothetical protein
MQIPIEQLLKLHDIQVLNVEITERKIKCDIESTRGYSILAPARTEIHQVL